MSKTTKRRVQRTRDEAPMHQVHVVGSATVHADAVARVLDESAALSAKPGSVETLANDSDLVVLVAGDDRAAATDSIREIQRDCCAPVLLIAPDADRRWGHLAQDCGAAAWVPLTTTPDILERRARELVEGAAPPGDTDGADRGVHAELTARELEIIDLLSRDKSLDEAADELGISPNTARTHLQNLMRKLGATCRADAIATVQGESAPRSVRGDCYIGSAPAAGVTTVAIAIGSALIRTGIRLGLDDEGDVAVVCEADDASGAVGAVRTHEPDVVLLESSLPGDGIGACVAMRDGGYEGRIVVVTWTPDPATLRVAMEAGADGFTAPQSLLDLADSLRRVADGEAYVPPHMLGSLLRDLIDRRRHEDVVVERFSRLSKREKHILSLLVTGQDHVAIAETLVVSPHTARTHIQNTLKKLEVHSRAEAIDLVYEFDLLTRFSSAKES